MTDHDNKYLHTFENILEECSLVLSKETDEDINAGLIDTMMKMNSYSKENAQEKLNTINRTILLMEKYQKDLSDSKGKGLSGEEWLAKKMDDSMSSLPHQTKLKIMSEINNSLCIESIEQEDLSYEELEPLHIDALKNSIMSNRYIDALEKGVSLDLSVFDNARSFDIQKEIHAYKSYFESPLGSSDDGKYIKTVSAATIIAKDKGLLPENFRQTTDDVVTMAVDQGLSTAKVAYKLGIGEISPINGLEYIIARKTSKLGAIIVDKCAITGANVGSGIGASIGGVFGPVGASIGATVGAIVGEYVGRKVGEIITGGARSICNFVGSTVGSVCSSVGNFFSSFLGL